MSRAGDLAARSDLPAGIAPETKIDLRVLDGIRGLAAAYVMVGHARWLLWEGNAAFGAHARSYGVVNWALAYGSAAFRYGYEAVILFFVLSGLVIHLRYARDLAVRPEQAAFDVRSYLRRRARRLYPPLFLAVAVTWLLDGVGAHLGFPIYRGDTPYVMINANIVPHHDWRTLGGNLVFLMGAYVPTFGTNGPLWSLKYEAWFYLTYPLVWLIGRRSVARATLLLASAFVLSALGGEWPGVLVWQVASKMFVWWLGALLAEGIAGRIAMRWGHLGLLGLMIPVLPFLNLSEWAKDLLWGLGFFGCFATLFALQVRGWRFRALSNLRWLGGMSYTLYVVHFPILVILSGWLMTRSPDHELPGHFGWVCVGVCASLALSWGAHLLIERPFTRTHVHVHRA